MNCRLCQENLEEYLEGNISPDMMTQVEVHLKECGECNRTFNDYITAEKVIGQEKELTPDPFLTSRIMAEIEKVSTIAPKKPVSPVRVLRPIVITVSAAAAIFFGVVLGNSLTNTKDVNKAPIELALSNDAVIESVNFLANE